jgi:hypothetical protein
MSIIRTNGLVFGTTQNQIDVASLPIATYLKNVVNSSNSPDLDIAIFPEYVELLAANLR